MKLLFFLFSIGLAAEALGQTDSLKRDTVQLKEAVVRARKPLYQQQMDGTVINVESSLFSKGSSALQVLERAPGVLIDHRNNSIALNGKNGVMVMVDGRLLRMTMEQVVSFLDGLSADDIEKIELLTTPPAKYDADGSAGLINIVLKKTKKPGTNGSFSLTGGYGWREKGTAALRLSHSTRRLNLYGSYTFSHDRTYSDLFITSHQDMPFMGGLLDVIAWDTTRATENAHDVLAGLDLKLDSQTTIGGSITYNGSHTSPFTANHSRYTILPDSLLLFDGSVAGTSRWQNTITSVYLERQIREGEKINVGLDYLSFINKGSSAVLNRVLTNDGKELTSTDPRYAATQNTYASTAIQVGAFRLDYNRQLSKKMKLEAGLKGTYTHDSSGSGIQRLVNGSWSSTPETSSTIVMKEGIGAAYLAVNTQINVSTSLITGLRYEYSHTRMNDPVTGRNTIDRKLGVLFPDIFFSKKLNDRSDLQLSYTKRISRPSYNDLASYVGYSDPVSAYTGNPFLKPTITNNIKAGYSYKGYSFSFLFSRDDYPIARYQIIESPSQDLLYVSPENLRWQNNLTVQTTLPWKVNSWWTMTYGFVGGLRQFSLDYTKEPLQHTYFSYAFNFTESFLLPKNFSAELSGWFNSTSYNGTIRVGAFGVLNAGLKKELKKNSGNLQLTVSDLFRNLHIDSWYGTLTKEAFSIKNHVLWQDESTRSPIIKLTWSRSFGSATAKGQKIPTPGAGEERDRVRKD